MYVITQFHWRDVPNVERKFTGIRLGVVVTAVQFPLDALAWLSIFYLNFPALNQAARQAVMLGLEIGYFWMLVVPYWMGQRKVSGG